MKVRNILGISGGKDSAALAIYLKQKYPNLKIEYYNSDTGCELAETELLIDRLSAYLGNIKRLRAAEDSPEPTPFEHFLKAAGGFLPSPQARWCTKKMKLDEFERYVGDDYAVSYVGIRGDEDRDGYVSSKPNIQSVFPFRRNIWSVDVINKFLHKENQEQIIDIYDKLCPEGLMKPYSSSRGSSWVGPAMTSSLPPPLVYPMNLSGWREEAIMQPSNSTIPKS